ncbi:hypothetical protein Xgly_02165 [Xanthomonas citri pv. glycines]|uniref:Uncharacterized protein n=1 Tax=Xanthomonas campestris pv. glycines TaxID=473421 RepID=A0AAX0HVP8_XANCG|nr:hypothetical protein A9D66_03200 [Xanthomonas citri pv. glycines str. 12-2]OEY88338.1 hypothetical protein BIY41_03155 [Xanthomonas citri pv. glycines]OOX01006.1 hypothetical protein Xgly_02165 [Xanthomonas citri pv. glycines]
MGDNVRSLLNVRFPWAYRRLDTAARDEISGPTIHKQVHIFKRRIRITTLDRAHDSVPSGYFGRCFVRTVTGKHLLASSSVIVRATGDFYCLCFELFPRKRSSGTVKAMLNFMSQDESQIACCCMLAVGIIHQRCKRQVNFLIAWIIGASRMRIV